MVLITYDVSTTSPEGRKRLRLVAKQCVNHGQRVQNSVFECMLDPGQFQILKNKLGELINKDEDSLRFYNLGNNWNNKIQHLGAKKTYNPEDPMIV